MSSVARSGLPAGAQGTGLNSHSLIQVLSQPCGGWSAFVAVSVMAAVDDMRRLLERVFLRYVPHGSGRRFKMALYRLGDDSPTIAPSAYVAPSASVIGKAVLAEQSSVWFGAILRGDNEIIRIGVGSNVQDGAVMHTDPGFPLLVGANVSIGHQAMLHGCTVGDGSLIGIQAVVLNAAVIGRGCLGGAGAVVTERKVFADGTLILGAPAKVVRELTAEERENLLEVAAHYAARGAYYRSQLQPIS